MAQTKNLGKVALTPRGVYSPGSSYEKLDIVTYSGSSWLALQDVQGVTPTSGVYWMQLTSKGDTGATGQAATVAVGTVTTVSPSSPATVTNSGTANAAVFDFEIPQGTAGTVTTVDSVSAVGGNVPLTAVVYGSAMNLNDTDKTQARDNISAAGLNSSSKVDPAQASSTIVSVSASKTLALTDAGTFQQANSTSTITITIPANASVPFPVGTEIEFTRWNTGAVTLAAATGVTLNSANNKKSIAARYGCAAIKQVTTNTWLLAGDLA